MAQQDPFIGRDILNGQFQILQKIGSGGMGSVYKALQPEMNRMVGVKILHPKLANRKDLVSRFRREARALSQLTHPNTVKVFLYGELDDGLLYIVMEFLEGKNLNQTVRADGPFSFGRALPILIQVCGALDEAHRAGIIHRDLKPENIFLVQSVTLRDFPKVLDFGLAKVGERQMRPGSVMLTQEGMVFGTPEFMSPEQAQGKPLTPASDVYSLAVILYEVLTGKLPFDARTAMDHIHLHVTGKPMLLNERVEGRTFPPALESIIDRALAKTADARFATAAEFAVAMHSVLHDPAAAPAGPNVSSWARIPGVSFTAPSAAQVKPTAWTHPGGQPVPRAQPGPPSARTQAAPPVPQAQPGSPSVRTQAAPPVPQAQPPSVRTQAAQSVPQPPSARAQAAQPVLQAQPGSPSARTQAAQPVPRTQPGSPSARTQAAQPAPQAQPGSPSARTQAAQPVPRAQPGSASARAQAALDSLADLPTQVPPLPPGVRISGASGSRTRMFMPSPTSPTLLVAVAISFMMLGVALAALLMKFVLK